MKKSKLLQFSFGLFALLLFSSTSFAQRKITGVVEDAKTNSPMAGATVSVRGSKTNTISKEGGTFEITIPAGKSSLIISFVGYQTKTVAVGASETSIHVNLTESANQLNDVVIVGMQTQSRRTSTAAISTVLSKDIENLPAPSVDQLLQGRVAGLNVQITSGEPGVAPTVVVRGNSTVNTSIGNSPDIAQAQALSGPLYVIDGVPTNPDDISNAMDATGTNYLAGININDIASVDIQKDAAATAAWGSRGSNGVIYITTKRGTSTTPEFRVNMYGGVTRVPQLLQTATGAAERTQKMDIINQYATPSQLNNLPQILTDMYNPSFNNATNWQGLFYRPGAIQNVDATVSAANKGVNYRVSMNYYNDKGIIQQTGFTRYSVRGNFDFTISPKINSQFIVSLVKNDRQKGMKYNNSDDNTPVSGANQPTSFYPLTAFDSSNFTGLYSKLRNKNIDDYYNTSFTLNYKVLSFLKYSFLGSANITASSKDYFQPSNIDAVSALGGIAQPSYAESDKGSYSTYFLTNSLNFNKSITTANNHVHNFVVTGSQQFSSDVSNTNTVSGYNVPSNNIQVVSGIPQANLSGSSSYAADAMLSFLGQVQYDYDSKYLLYGSYRTDASSRFGNNSKWGTFPAVGLGWIISDEKFMDKIKNVVSFLKIRGSWGISGGQSSDFYAPYNSYIQPGTYNGSVAIQPNYTNGLTKNDLTWSRMFQKDIGIDAQFFNSRIILAVDVYDKLSKGDFYDFQLPFFTGFGSVNFNANDLWVSNRGVDVTINTHNFSHSSSLQWNMTITLSNNKNLIAKLPNNNRTFEIDDYYGVGRIYAVGQPIYEMFQLKYAGVYNNQSEIPFDPLTGKSLTYFKGNHVVVPGDPIFVDVNKIGDVWDNEDNGAQYGDRVPTGDPNPKFTGGWVNTFSYKNFSLSILSVFTWKRTVVNTYFQQQISSVVGGYYSNIYTFANSRLPDLSGLNYWTPQNATKGGSNYKAGFPSINPFGPSYYQYIPISSMFNADGSYFKIGSVSLAYSLPHSWITKAKLKGASIYCTIDNIATLKNSTMPNPELVDQLGIYTGGAYPTPTDFTLGADVRF
ncbi:MAG TPA: SusC/RagA family TonB-linked outer membrane protein [Hanamia sp.]